jgi:hypothetical protein
MQVHYILEYYCKAWIELLDVVIVLNYLHAHYMYTDYKYVPKMKIYFFSVQFYLRLLKLPSIHILFNQTTNIVC